jgi:hypothetical protein
MMIWRPLVVLGAALVLILGSITSLADAKPSKPMTKGSSQKSGGKGTGHYHHGVIKHIDEKAGTFTIKTHHAKKSSTAAAGGPKKAGKKPQAAGKKAGKKGGEHTFKLVASTKVDGKPGDFGKLQVGKKVAVKAEKHVAHDVKTKHKSKKKPAKKPGKK